MPESWAISVEALFIFQPIERRNGIWMVRKQLIREEVQGYLGGEPNTQNQSQLTPAFSRQRFGALKMNE